MNKFIAWTFMNTNGAVSYCADLPGCDGAKKNPTTPNSDWGYTGKESQALALTEGQWKKFAKYQRDCGRVAFCCLV